jgi:hypothetical protein
VVVIYLVLLIVLLLTTFLVYRYKERCLYVLFLAAYTQNFVVAFLYTHGYIGRDLARGLLLLKDFLLLAIFAWCVVLLFKRFRPPWPRPLKPLLLLTAYCGFRFLVGVVFLNDSLGQGLTRMRNIFFPLEILVVVMVVAAMKPEFGHRFLRDITYILSALAIVAVAIVLWAPRDFWLDTANIAQLQVDVKNDTETDMNFEEGLTFSGTMANRDALMSLFYFRAIGTFGDALALGFSMAVPVLLLSFYFKKSTLSVLSLIVAAAALVLSLTRSAWVFCAVTGIYVSIRRRQYLPLLAAASAILAFFLLWPAMADFATTTISRITPGADNPDSGHAEGVVWFYTRALPDSRNILGKGMKAEDKEIVESGYAYLIEHFGALAYASFLWFCISLYRQLRIAGTRDPGLSTLAQGVPLGLLVIMHFSQYPFSLPAFMSLWYIVGLCLSQYLVPRKELARGLVRQSGQASSFQPA